MRPSISRNRPRLLSLKPIFRLAFCDCVPTCQADPFSVIFRGIMVGNRRQFERMCGAISISKLRPLIDQVFDFKDARKVRLASSRLLFVTVFLSSLIDY